MQLFIEKGLRLEKNLRFMVKIEARFRKKLSKSEKYCIMMKSKREESLWKRYIFLDIKDRIQIP